MTDGTWCAKCRGPVKGYDTYCDRCGDTWEKTEMTNNMLPISFEPEHIGAICRAFDINWDSQYGMNNASFADDIVERIEDLQRYVKELEVERDELKAEVKHLSGATMVLRNGKKVSEIEYYRLRFPKMVERIKEASRLLNEHSDY